ncbi:hypothetical protein C7B82_08650 [Stenomitos frigidus ULC18]|uniref:Uncharacterized protein n=1 Tax=Stenomitos frigidus ULC18 TaxID=2107698 RepID=A0A2T1ECM9_9CYAN|nr:hypothetical protein C7B82_08650 [Stenomitos frigidus ULC18]
MNADAGWLLARLAIRSIPVTAIVPPLSMVDVSIECSTQCVPLRSMGVTPLRHYYEDIRLPMAYWASSWLTSCAALPRQAGSPWDLPSSRLCHSDVPRSTTPVDSRQSWRLTALILPSALHKASASTVSRSYRG